MEQFTTQSEPAYCGISSLVMVLNALAVDPRRLWKGPWRWYHEELLNCCMDLEDIKKVGITLNTFSCLAKCQGLKVDKYFAEDQTLQDFREAVELTCVERDDDSGEGFLESKDPLLVVSYNRQILKQTGTGHFSPIAAFDKVSDQVLILDTARFKYGAHWVPLPLLFEAMMPVDPDTGKSRGYALLSYNHFDKESPVMPISILLWSAKDQNPVRQRYKHFLMQKGSSEVTWDEVVDFWTCSGDNQDYVWDMIEPQLAPIDEDTVEAVAAVRKLGQSLIPGFQEAENRCCRHNANRVIDLDTKEAMLVVYLASLSLDRRTEIICADSVEAEDLTRQQLLIEADLVRNAIEVSDDLAEDLERLEHAM
jgi:glutathione gamma-glutamylcysteinyltransferase